jgi:hypothetical protein
LIPLCLTRKLTPDGDEPTVLLGDLGAEQRARQSEAAADRRGVVTIGESRVAELELQRRGARCSTTSTWRCSTWVLPTATARDLIQDLRKVNRPAEVLVLSATLDRRETMGSPASSSADPARSSGIVGPRRTT